MADEKRSGIGEGFRTGIGILSAVKDAIEETFEEAVERGDLSQERAKAAVRDAATRVQHSLDDARDRLDMVPRREFEKLREEVAELRARVDALAGGTTGRAEPDAGSEQQIPVD